MITVDIHTERGKETWQMTERDDGWYIRKDPDLQWSREPFADAEAERDEVIDKLKQEKGAQ